MSTAGVEFRAIRESRGLTVDRIASATRIPVRYIEALERDDLRALPARPYLRGFVAAYGRELGLDPTETVARYFSQLGPPPPEPAIAVDVPSDEPGYSRAWGIAVLALAALLIIPAFNRWRSAVEPPQPPVAGTAGTAPAAAPASASITPAAVPPCDRPEHDDAGPRRALGFDDLRTSLLARRFSRRHTNRLQDDGARLEPGTEGAARNRDSRRRCRCGRMDRERPRSRTMGRPGQVRDIVVTHENVQRIK